MAIKINKTEDRKVTLNYTAQDESGNAVVTFNAEIGTREYEAGTFNKLINNKQAYFADLPKYKAIETEFETEYEAQAVIVLGGSK